MKRGVFLLLATGVVVFAWSVAPVGSSVATPSQRTTTTIAAPTTVATTVPETVATTVAPAVATTAPTSVEPDDATQREDPAATRLRRITYAMLGLGAVLLIGTALFWRATRPALLRQPDADAAKRPDRTPVPAAGTGGWDQATAHAEQASSSPAKIPASVILATPPGPPLAATLAGTAALAAPAVPVPVPVPAADDAFADAPPPTGEPAIDAPPPLDDIPLGGARPLVGSDSAWIIEPESPSGLITDVPSAGDFPEESAEAEPLDVDPSSDRDTVIDVTGSESRPAAIEVTASEAGASGRPQVPAATQALISALSAIPDKEPTVVRFDDPPVERVRPRDPAPSGAPGYDRQAKERAGDTARSSSVEAGRSSSLDAARSSSLDDMALMASALSSLPPREPPREPSAEPSLELPRVIPPDPPDVPPVGEFYDQDLDPGDPPGRR